MTRLLVIDDDPERYDYLRRETEGRLDVVLVSCADCVADNADVAAVLLDHDLRRPCPACGAMTPVSTRGLVGGLAEMRVPVIVTSCSSVENVRWLVTELRRRGVVVAQHSAFEPECELRWVGRLWMWGIL